MATTTRQTFTCPLCAATRTVAGAFTSTARQWCDSGHQPAAMRPRSVTEATSRAARALGALGGSAGTAPQHAARKRNAQLAGRPRRVCTTCAQPVVGGHVDRALDTSCGAHGWRWQSRAEQLQHD